MPIEVWVIALALAVAVPLVFEWLGDGPAVKAAKCSAFHTHRRVSRVPVGPIDWVETYECPQCGDRWCDRLP